MKSLQIEEYGKIDEVTQLVETDLPEPESNQVVVQLLASPIHPSNVMLIKGEYVQVKFPHKLGTEGLGKVTKVGTDVDNLSVGDVVLLPGGKPAWQTEMLANANQLHALPVKDKDMMLQLAMTSINPPTAYLMLHNFVDLEEGDWVIQNAANSAVGRYLIQFAHNMGVKTINVVRRAELKEELKAIGADAVVVDGDNLAQQVKEIVGDGKVRLGIDAVAGEASSRLLSCLSKGATMVVYGSMSLQPIKIQLGPLLANEAVITSFWLSKWYRETDPSEIMPLLQKISKMILEGKLSTKISKTFSLDQYKEALNYADSEAKGGKVLFTNFD